MNETIIISNVDLARAVVDALAELGYDVNYNQILDEIDIERSPEEEQRPEKPTIIKAYTDGFLAQLESAADWN